MEKQNRKKKTQSTEYSYPVFAKLVQSVHILLITSLSASSGFIEGIRENKYPNSSAWPAPVIKVWKAIIMSRTWATFEFNRFLNKLSTVNVTSIRSRAYNYRVDLKFTPILGRINLLRKFDQLSVKCNIHINVDIKIVLKVDLVANFYGMNFVVSLS